MSNALDCSIVDVFAERPFTGNQLAVVRGCSGLDSATMLTIAREFDFSETAFVIEENADSARVRIFTPTVELPFAGHPVLGTAWVVADGAGTCVLEVDAGPVPVTFDAGGVAWMTPPQPEFGEMLDLDTAAALLDLSATDLDTACPPRRAAVGPSFILIGLRTLDALRRARVVPRVHARVAEGIFTGIFVFAAEAYSRDADFAARLYFEANGWREDPATGSANTAFAAYLRERGIRGRVTVEQGFEIDRPSRLYLDLGEPIRVGGKVQPVMTGVLKTAGLRA